MQKSPHNTTPEQPPSLPNVTPTKTIVGVDVSHLDDEQHSTLIAIVESIVRLVLGLVFRK